VLPATIPSGFTETVLTNALSSPTAMTIAPDGRVFVCQQGGALRVIKNGALLATPFLTVTTTTSGERGLLGVAFDPNFAVNNFVYVYYTATTPATHNRISRFTANGDVAVAGSEVVILDLENLSAATNHNGGAIHFGPDGKLYVAVGENANAANSQSISTRLGKILRINTDGSPAAGNPTSFPNIAGTTTGANQAIWAVGVRNPFTFTFQPGTGRLFINDVGQNTWEEVNDGIAGSNYGWSICEGVCGTAGMTNPIYTYNHTSGTPTGCAIIGAAFYNPSTATFPASYVGKYFFGDLCGGYIRYLDPASPGTSTPFASGISNLVDLAVSSQGDLYYLARSASAATGVLSRISANPPTAAAVLVSGRVLTAGGAGLRGAAVSIVDSQGNARTVVANSFGYYRFNNVVSGDSYVLWVNSKQYRYTPQVLEVKDELTGVDFYPEQPLRGTKAAHADLRR
jgi:glucose/arabinose dehydrogenase